MLETDDQTWVSYHMGDGGRSCDARVSFRLPSRLCSLPIYNDGLGLVLDMGALKGVKQPVLVKTGPLSGYPAVLSSIGVCEGEKRWCEKCV